MLAGLSRRSPSWLSVQVLSPAISIIEDIVANNETTPAAITFAQNDILPVRTGRHLTSTCTTPCVWQQQATLDMLCWPESHER